MKIVDIACENIAGVPDGQYSFRAAGRLDPEPLILVAGVRGAGKSSLLRAIVALKELIGAYGRPPESRRLVQRPEARSRLGGTFLLDPAEQREAGSSTAEVHVELNLGEPRALAEGPVRRLFERYDHDDRRWKLEYFPANRNLGGGGAPTTEDDERRLRPGSAMTKYHGLVPSIVSLALADGARSLEETRRRGVLLREDAPDSLVPYRVALTTMVPELRLRGVVESADGLSLGFDRRDGTLIFTEALSEGQRQGFLFAASIVRLGLSSSTVLIDSPELHIHVADQARFVAALSSLLPAAQLIVATGSSEIMKGARREQVIALG